MAIEETVSAAEANRSFSRLLRGVREGRSYVVTAHDRPIGRLEPDRRGGRSGRWGARSGQTGIAAPAGEPAGHRFRPVDARRALRSVRAALDTNILA